MSASTIPTCSCAACHAATCACIDTSARAERGATAPAACCCGSACTCDVCACPPSCGCAA